jgi:hypothetical protein
LSAWAGLLDSRESDVGGIEADERVHSVFGALDGFGFNFVECAFFLRLLSAAAGRQCDQDQTCKQALKSLSQRDSPHGGYFAFVSAAW